MAGTNTKQFGTLWNALVARCRIHAMPCKTCSHRDRTTIDQLIVSGTALRPISARFGLSLGSLHRHKTCIKQVLAAAMRSGEGERQEHAKSLLSRVEELISEAQDVCRLAKADKKFAAASNALNSVGRSLELIGKLTGEIAAPVNAGGIHLNLTSNRTTIKYSPGDDTELAELVSEATNNFDPNELARLQRLVATPVENASFTELSCNNLATLPERR